MKKLLCFDLNGTLVDSTTALVFTFNEVFRRNNLPAVSSEELRDAFGRDIIDIIRRFAPSVSSRKLEQCLIDFKEVFKKNFNKISVVEGAEAMLRSLKRKGYSLAVISNLTKEEIIDILEESGLGFEHFDEIISGGENLSTSNEDFKSAKLSKKEAEFMIGDSVSDIRAGKKAGVKTIAVVSGASIRTIWNEKPNIIVNRVSEIESIL